MAYPVRHALMFMFRHYPDAITPINTLVLGEEHFWERSGRHVVFPLPEVINDLLDAKFQLGSESPFAGPMKARWLHCRIRGGWRMSMVS